MGTHGAIIPVWGLFTVEPCYRMERPSYCRDGCGGRGISHPHGINPYLRRVGCRVDDSRAVPAPSALFDSLVPSSRSEGQALTPSTGIKSPQGSLMASNSLIYKQEMPLPKSPFLQS